MPSSSPKPFETDPNGLTAINFTGGFPFSKGEASKDYGLPNDPYFILGNYRFTAFPHISGKVELFTEERVCAKVNFDPASGYGGSFSRLRIGGQESIDLTETPDDALAGAVERRFGCGYAEYRYDLGGGLRLRKVYAVRPSMEINEGLPALFYRVTLSNESSEPIKLTYEEGLVARYTPMNFEAEPHFPCRIEQPNPALAVARFHAESDDPLLVPNPETASKYEARPPAVFMQALADDATCAVQVRQTEGTAAELVARFEVNLAPGEKVTFALAVGYAHAEASEVAEEVQALAPVVLGQSIPFHDEWRERLPDYAEEQDPAQRRELIWNAYVLESMATYNAYFEGTHIPQGMLYDYHYGVAGGARDYCQHALAACYFNPELARSCLLYLCARMKHDGEIVFVTYGYGNPHIGVHQPSDKQLFFFMLFAEYLRITSDFDVLRIETPFFPKEAADGSTVSDKIIRAFRYLRDVVGRGDNGLIRAMNSDWNDDFFNEYPINRYSGAESVLNTAVACAWLPRLIEQLEAAVLNPAVADDEGARFSALIQSLGSYLKQVREAFDSHAWSGTGHLKRMLLAPGEEVGVDNFFLAPHAYALQIPDLEEADKREILKQVKARLDVGETLGPRLCEHPYTRTDPAGVRINGGFWFALAGAFIMGLASFDEDEAQRYLKRMTFSHFARNHPECWAGHWSALDASNSSLARSPGGPGEGAFAQYPLFCAHPHAWPLYLWHRVREAHSKAVAYRKSPPRLRQGDKN